MAEYIDKEKALSTLENTAKYYEMPNADEWTKGIHYGLIHGVDNIVDNVPIADVVEREKIDKAIEEIEQTLYVDSLIFGELIDFKDGKISADDVIEEFNRVTRKEVLEILKRNIGESK